MILDEGLTELASRFQADVTNGQAGTGTTIPTADDTGLETAVTATLLSLTSSSSANSSQHIHTISSTTGNGSTFTEWEIQFDDGNSWNRIVGAGISKTSSFEIVSIFTNNFVRQ